MKGLYPIIAFGIIGVTALSEIGRFTTLKTTSFYVLIPLFISVFIPLSIVVLVPIDLASSTKHSKSKSFYLSEELRLYLWKVIYWTAFALTWAILPLLQSYVVSGYNSCLKRLKDAVKENLVYQFIMIVSALLGLLYVSASNRLTFSTAESLVIALSYTYALIMALWMMGHGLVSIPQKLWVESNPEIKLDRINVNATQANDHLADVQTKYAEVASEILELASGNRDSKFRQWISELVDLVEAGPGIALNFELGRYRRPRRYKNELSEKHLASLARRFKYIKSQLVRYDAVWQKQLFEASKAEDIIASYESRQLIFRFQYSVLSPGACYTYYVWIVPFVRRTVSLFLSLLTISIIASEMLHGTKYSIVDYAILNSSGFHQQLLSSMFLGYMCSAALVCLTQIKVFQYYALVYRHSSKASLLFYAMYACRLTIPLSFNFITLINSRTCVFEDYLGSSINLTPLGSWFSSWYPRFTIIFVVMSLFNVYDKAKYWLGLGADRITDEEISEEGNSIKEIDEGRALIRRSLTDPEYRFRLRHPDLEFHSGTGNSSASSVRSVTSQGPSRRTSPSHINQLNKRPLHTQLMLGGGHVRRSRIHDQTSLIGSKKHVVYGDDEESDDGSGSRNLEGLVKTVNQKVRDVFKKPQETENNDDSSV